MKLLQISITLLTIFVINVQSGDDFIRFDLTGTSPIDMIKLALKILHYIVDVARPNKTPENLVTIIGEVDKISSQLDSFETHMDLKLDTMLDELFAVIKISPHLHYSKVKLCQYINKIDHYFDHSDVIKFGGKFGNDTLKKFGNTALWCGDNLPDVLNNLLDLFIPNMNKPGFLTLMHQRNLIRYTNDCTGQSAQQQMYFTFIKLIASEIKGLVTLGRIFMLQRLFDETSHSYIPEMELMKTNFLKRMDKYYEIFSRDLSYFPRDLRPCEVKSPERNEDFFELENFSRAFFFDLAWPNLKTCYHCRVDGLLTNKNLNYTVHNCKVEQVPLKFCIADPTEHREIMWWKDKRNIKYGIEGHCLRETWSDRHIYSVDGIGSHACDECICSKFQNGIQSTEESSNWRVSISDQVSDRWNNKVVTGIRFVNHKNALHIQIQQSKVSSLGLIHDEPEWKELDHHYDAQGRAKTVKIQYLPLNYDRRTLHLDEIQVPDGYTITGVRFQIRDDSAIELEAQATPYDFATGLLSLTKSRWIVAVNNPVKYEEYDNLRQEIVMIDAHDPSKGSGFKYIEKSNKKIKFIHTDIHKDAGQTTIPFIDTHLVETSPPFPLSGIGMSYRQKLGFGGYIAPRIFTINIQNYMKSFNFSELMDDERLSVN